MTGALADHIAVDCAGCGCALLVPARLATEAGGPRCHGCMSEQTDAEARAHAEKVRRGTDKTDNNPRGK